MISPRATVIAGTAIAFAAAALLSPFASSSPDGLDRVAQDQGIEEAETPVWRHAALPDYKMPGLDSEAVATSLAGLVGTVLVLVVGYGIGRLLTLRRAS